MTKIGTKLLLGSVMFICILILHTVLGQMTTRQAIESQNTLTERTAPAVTLLNNIRIDNKELFLLLATRVVDSTNQLFSNRVEQLVDFDFPECIAKMIVLKRSLEPTDVRNKNIDSIVDIASKYIDLSKQINTLLGTLSEGQEAVKFESIQDLHANQLSSFSTEIDTRVSFLQVEYNQELENNISELSGALQSNSQFFLWTSLIFICFGLIITYRNIISIVKPIDALLNTVGSIQDGNYDKRVSISGTDELSELGNAFNQMSDSLQTSFGEIKLKNKELEHFVYIASHDLQEPLRTVNSFTELLVTEYQDTLDEKANTYIHFISEASTRMSLLVKGLLDYSRIGVHKKLTLVHCNELVKGVLVNLMDVIESKRAIIEIDDLPELYAYKTELGILFHNIIDNAIKFNLPKVIPMITIRAEEEKDSWIFVITDNGIGIKEHQKEKIFSMFHRLNPQKQYTGIGIGLTHCLKIAEIHDGYISVDSQLGEGSAFRIRIAKYVHRT